jgi:hypothetical protein
LRNLRADTHKGATYIADRKNTEGNAHPAKDDEENDEQIKVPGVAVTEGLCLQEKLLAVSLLGKDQITPFLLGIVEPLARIC